jgi:acyl-CoA reductase-like NAD-dependent aldehyde dehydrogenase
LTSSGQHSIYLFNGVDDGGLVDYKLLIGGEWAGSGDALEVKNKYDGSTVGTLPTVSRDDLDRAIDAAERAKELMADMPAYERAEILSKLQQANNTKFGLQVGVFTKDIDRVFKAVKRLNFGGVIVNDTPSFRADHMPYGGNRQSGLGCEGVRFAMEEMTNIQLVALRLNS